ncbi:MAG: plasmid mobilization protein [Sphingobacterium sp.]
MGLKITNKTMDKPRKKAGRPPMLSGKRNRLIKAKLTEEEFSELIRIQKASGMNRMELIRKRVLGSGTAVTVNMKEVLGELDTIGAELGRAGNNINQLARHANILNRQQRLDPGVVAEFNALFTEYIRTQRELEKTLRQLLRTMK